MVLVDRQLPGGPYDAVIVDNLAAARMVTDYLVRLNHERIAIVIGREHLSTTDQRVQGYRDALQAARLELHPDLEVVADSRIETAYAATQRLLSMPDPPSAIFAANNLMMLGAIEAILDMGFRCPEQVSLAGIDDFPWSSAIRPQLTTVSQPIEEMGTHAVEKLLDRIAKKTVAKRTTANTTVLQPSFLIRDSCANRVAPTRSKQQTTRKRHAR